MSRKKTQLLLKRVRERVADELEQSGGGCSLSSSGSFGNVIDQLGCMVVEGVESIVYGLKLAESVITLPGDLAWDFERPNEPMPSNTPVAKIIART